MVRAAASPAVRAGWCSEPHSAFTEGAGTTTGTKPVVVRDGSLAYTGAGASTIALHGESTLSGSLSAGQTLSIESTGGENAKVIASASFASAGSITLTNGDGARQQRDARGLLGDADQQRHVDERTGPRGRRTLAGQHHQHGHDRDQREHAYNGTKAQLTNGARSKIAKRRPAVGRPKETIDNEAGGTIAAWHGMLLHGRGHVRRGRGQNDAARSRDRRKSQRSHYTGAGASTIAPRRRQHVQRQPRQRPALVDPEHGGV